MKNNIFYKLEKYFYICILLFGIYFILVDIIKIMNHTFYYPERLKDVPSAIGLVLVFSSLYKLQNLKDKKL